MGRKQKLGSYEIYVDDEFLMDNIEPGQQYVETLLENLDEIDEYDLGKEENFFVEDIKKKNR